MQSSFGRDIKAASAGSSPMIGEAVLMVEEGQAMLALAKKELSPNFILGGGWEFKGRLAGMYEIMVGVEVPLYLKHKQAKMLEESLARLASSKSGLSSVRNDVASMITEDFLKARLHGICAGEMQAMEAAGRTLFDFPDAPWEFIMMFLVNTEHEGLTVLPTHRLIDGVLNSIPDTELTGHRQARLLLQPARAAQRQVACSVGDDHRAMRGDVGLGKRLLDAR